MPKPKLYHNRIDALTTRRQWLAIKAYAKQHIFKLGEATRKLVDSGLHADSDIKEAYDQGYADGAGRRLSRDQALGKAE